MIRCDTLNVAQLCRKVRDILKLREMKENSYEIARNGGIGSGITEK